MAIEDAAVAYSLTAAVSALVEDMPGASLQEIAERVVEEMPDSEKDAILRKALVDQVRRILGRQRSDAMDHSSKASRFDTAGEIAWEVKLLRSQVNVNGRMRALGEMGRKDCIDAAREREWQARQNASRAKQFKALAAVLNARDLSTVAEIPVDDLKKIFNA